jgi:hypothetical protein
VQGEAEVEQLGLVLADQAGQRDRGAHVGQRIVRRFVQQAIGLGQVFQLEAGLAIFLGRPVDAFGAARRSCAPRPANPSGRSRFAIRAHTDRSGCART